MEKRRINVRGIIYRDNKVLAVKHLTSSGGEADYWAIPGGGLDPKESLQHGLIRELLEETGIEAKVGRLLFVQQFPSSRTGRDEELEFFFHVENPDDFEEIDLTITTHGVAEIARIEFIDPAKERILPPFLGTLALDNYIDTDQPVFFYDGFSEEI